MSQISDSEPDISLSVAEVSRETFRTLFAALPGSSQSTVAARLRSSRYGNLLEDSIFDQHSDIGPEDHQAGWRTHTDHEDMQIALETLKPLDTARRGLRKRNFASTHPYLTDMAHWLGIASANYLNDVYEQHHDVLPILRLLNTEYLRKKEKYPNEERYKWKSFYKLIGKSHPQYNLPTDSAQPGTTFSSQSADNSSNSGSDSDLNVSRNRTILIVDSEEERQVEFVGSSERESDSDSSSASSSQVVVQVGGRVRKEKSVLRGVLPESAKRLNLWKAPKSSSKSRTNIREQRKGLAIRKKTTATKLDVPQMEQFIDEGDLYQEVYGTEDLPISAVNEDYESLQQRSEVFDQKYNDYYSVSSDSDVSLPDYSLPLDNTSNNNGETLTTSIYVADKPHSLGPTRASDHAPRQQRDPAFNIDDFYTGEAIEARDEIDRQVTATRNSGAPKEPRNLTSKPRNIKPRHLRQQRVSRSKALRHKKARRDAPLTNFTHPLLPPKVANRKDNRKNLLGNTYKPENASHQSILSNYYFRREPVMSTVTFEAESNNRFVKPLHPTLQSERPISTEPSKNDFMRHLPSIHSLDHQRPDFGFNHTQIANISDHKYTFTLLSKEQSKKDSLSFLNKIMRICKSSPEKVYVVHDIVQSLKAFINWQLTLQEPLGQMEKDYLDSSLEVFVKHKRLSLDPILPFLLLLQYICLKISQRTLIARSDDERFAQFVSGFWVRCYDAFENEDLLFADDSFQLVFSIMQSDWSLFWKSMHYALKRGVGNQILTLRALYAISLNVPSASYDWESFYRLFESTSPLDSSEFYVTFVFVCFSLIKRRNWPLDEKLILKLYSVVTRKRFFNFKDEPNVILYLGKVRTMGDLPDNTFFDKFVTLLYYYVSSLDNVASAKRLSLKMMIASQYVHEKNDSHRAALANRMNLIVLLAQLSEVNQTNSLISLIKAIAETEDIEVYYLTVKQLAIFCDVIKERPKQFPIEGFQILINKVIKVYATLPGITKVWIQLSAYLKKSLLIDSEPVSIPHALLFLEIFNRVNLRGAHDDIGFRLLEILEASTLALDLFKADFLEKSPLLTEIINNLIAFLHHQLGRFPMESSIREKRLVSTVERCITVWCRLTAMSSSPNWNKIILADYPYIGNSYARNMFSLLLLAKILEYTKLSQHADLILSSLLKALASFNTSPYVAPLMNSLKANNVSAVDLTRVHLQNNLTAIELNNNKPQIILAIISNISDSNMQESRKAFLVGSFVKTLNDEYDKHYLSPRFAEFCKKTAEYVEAYCGDQIKDLREAGELARKLGITPVDRERLKWRALSRIDQLKMLHEEIMSSVLHERDVTGTLNHYLEMKSMTNIFHLISIYMKAVSNSQTQCWFLLSILLDYVVEKLQIFGIDTSSREFGKFVMALEDMTLLFVSHWGSRYTHSLQNYQLNCLEKSCNIVKEAFFNFDGYKDRSFIDEVIQKQLVDYSLPSSGKQINLSKPFSSFKLYDIMMNHKALAQLDEQLMIPEHEKYDISKSMGELELLTAPVKKSALLEFDFDLA